MFLDKSPKIYNVQSQLLRPPSSHMTHHMVLNLTCTESAVVAAILSRDTSHVSKSESCDWSAADRPLLLVCECAGSLPDFPLLRLVNKSI